MNTPEKDLNRHFSDEELRDLWKEAREGRCEDDELMGALLASSLKDEPEASPSPVFARSVMNEIENLPMPGQASTEMKMASVSFILSVFGLTALFSFVQWSFLKWWGSGKTFTISLQPLKHFLIGMYDCLEIFYLLILELIKKMSLSPSATLTLASVMVLALIALLTMSKPKPAPVNGTMV